MKPTTPEPILHARDSQMSMIIHSLIKRHGPFVGIMLMMKMGIRLKRPR